MNYDPNVTTHKGRAGTAVRLTLPDTPDAAETVCSYLITAPAAHPLWSQYALFVVRLRKDIPGFPDPVLKFDGATHELDVVALNPEHGPYTQEKCTAGEPQHYLTPVNISEQFTATDDEMLHLADLCAQGVAHGVLWPETGDAPTRIRQDWLTSMVRTLAHIRGEEHAS